MIENETLKQVKKKYFIYLFVKFKYLICIYFFFLIVMSGQETECIDIFLCHTQAVERAVKLVTDASRVDYSEFARNGFLQARIKFRAKLPSFNTKIDFKLFK